MKKSKLVRETIIFELEDHGQLKIPAVMLVRGDVPRNAQGLSARLAHQFLNQNLGILRDFEIKGDVQFDGSAVYIQLHAGGQVGALPLLSPTSGRPDYGLVIKPRFGWQGIGPMLGSMGWKVIPIPLRLPLLPRSDRKIPPWVLSTTILLRLQKLLESLDRSFEFTEDDLTAPRGQVNWTRYATTNIPRAGFMNVPCRFPDLKDDRDLKGAIHYTLRKQLSSLQSQRTAGVIVLQLISLCQSLLEKVRDVPTIMPTQHTINRWLHGNLSTEIFRKGIQAVEWTVEDRGLAGLGDLQGLPWVLPMDQFFEAWVETVAGQLAKSTGGILKRGRHRETLTPLSWSPPYLGSQRYLLPDLILEREGETIIIDAKYKNHWEELNRESWAGLEKELQEQHREDLLQVLAYSTASESKRVVCCLVYPCRERTWHSLLKRQRLFHKASVRAGSRRVELILTAVPMGVNPEEIWPELGRAISA
ncbi:MAG: 5-methylcytosine restriction system specificity protein McrC [Dethiobacteria bacterium]